MIFLFFREYKYTREIAAAVEPTAEAIDIRADYVAKYGAPSAAAAGGGES